MQRAFLAFPFLFLAGIPSSGQTPAEKTASIAFVRGLQGNDGGFRVASGQDQSSLRATTSALRALKYLGGEPANCAAASEFVKHCFDSKTGGFADHPGGKVDVFATAVGFMAVKELKLDPEPYEAAVILFLGTKAKEFEEIRMAAAALEVATKSAPYAQTWTEDILLDLLRALLKSRLNNDQSRDMARYIVTALRLSKTLEMDDREQFAALIKTFSNESLPIMKKGQGRDGGFHKEGEAGSDLETSYQVMRAFHMLKAKPQVEKMRGFIATCRNKDGGYGVAPGKPSTVPATYYSAIILHWLNEE